MIQHQTCMDCLVFYATKPNDYYDFQFFDPPYGVLTGHKIETVINIAAVFAEVMRTSKPNSFIAFTGQEPTIGAWVDGARAAGFRYSNKIIWAKRIITSPYLELQRTFEEIYIFYKPEADAKVPKYYDALERYEDLKTSALHLGIYELSTINCTLADLQHRLNDPEYDAMYYSGMPTSNGAMTGHTNDVWHQKKLGGVFDKALNNDARHAKTFKAKRKNSDLEKRAKEYEKNRPATGAGRGNDMLGARAAARFQKRTNLKDADLKAHDDKVNNDGIFAERYPNAKGFRYRSKWYCNVLNLWTFPHEEYTLEWFLLKEGTSKRHIFKALGQLFSQLPKAHGLESTIWSYLPENQTKMGSKGINIKHPTVKPTKLLLRLIKLLCPEPTEEITPTICDCFAGSGTTLVAAAILGINCDGCDILQEFCDIGNKRVELALVGHNGSGVDFSANAEPKIIKPKPQLTLF